MPNEFDNGEFNIGDINIYNVLGCSPGCTHDDMERAYREKAKEFHPDKQTSMQAEISSIEENLKTSNEYKTKKERDTAEEKLFKLKDEIKRTEKEFRRATFAWEYFQDENKYAKRIQEHDATWTKYEEPEFTLADVSDIKNPIMQKRIQNQAAKLKSVVDLLQPYQHKTEQYLKLYEQIKPEQEDEQDQRDPYLLENIERNRNYFQKAFGLKVEAEAKKLEAIVRAKDIKSDRTSEYAYSYTQYQTALNALSEFLEKASPYTDYAIIEVGKEQRREIQVPSIKRKEQIEDSTETKDFLAKKRSQLLFNIDKIIKAVPAHHINLYNLYSLKRVLETRQEITPQEIVSYMTSFDDPILIQALQKYGLDKELTEKKQEHSLKEIVDIRISSLESQMEEIYEQELIETLKKSSENNEQAETVLTEIASRDKSISQKDPIEIIDYSKNRFPLLSRKYEGNITARELYHEVSKLLLDDKEGKITPEEYLARIEEIIRPLQTRVDELGIDTKVAALLKNNYSAVKKASKNSDITDLIFQFGTSAGIGITTGILYHNFAAGGIIGAFTYGLILTSKRSVKNTTNKIVDYTKAKIKLSRQKLIDKYAPNPYSIGGFYIPGLVYVTIGHSLKAAENIYDVIGKIATHFGNENVDNFVKTALNNYDKLPDPIQFLANIAPLMATYFLAGIKIGEPGNEITIGRWPKVNFKDMGGFLATIIKHAIWWPLFGWNIFPAYCVKSIAERITPFKGYKEAIDQKYANDEAEIKRLLIGKAKKEGDKNDA